MLGKLKIFFSDKKPIYGNFFPENENYTDLDLITQRNYSSKSVLYINSKGFKTQISFGGESKIIELLKKNGFSIFDIDQKTEENISLKEKIKYYYPEVNFDDSNLGINSDLLRAQILKELGFENNNLKTPGLLIPIKTYSHHAKNTSLYAYLFVDFTLFENLEELLNFLSKIAPVIKIDFNFDNTRPFKFLNFFLKDLFIRSQKQHLQAKIDITSVLNPYDGYEKIILFDIAEKKKIGDVYFSLNPKSNPKKRTYDFNKEQEYSEMLKKALSVRNNISALAENGFEELAILAIVKGLGLTEQEELKAFQHKFLTAHDEPQKVKNANWFLESKHQLSSLYITKDYRILLKEYNIEIVLNPLHKSIYFLFLNHPEGIYLSQIKDYQEELMHWYLKLSNRKLSDSFEKSIADICNPKKNSLYEKLSRIKKEFTAQLEDSLAEMYYIKSELIFMEKKVELPRELVVWEK